MTMPNRAPELQLREEFNRWAEAGRGEEMEESHLPIVAPTLTLMDLQPADRVLDVGCGSGWLVRRLAALVPSGSVVGIDVSDEMIRRAQHASAGIPNTRFLHGTAERIPAESNSFTKALSVESAYYWHDPARGVGEIFRVLAPGGSAWILINYYRDNLDCHQWNFHFQIPTHLLSAAEWQDHFRAAGFRDVHHRSIPDLSPTPEVYTGRWFRDAAQMQRFKAKGALLVTGAKP
ncbi:MAG TPA: methyltransferase domain-containing protein [Terriglobia bacterium]|nr:methyltransferase domain-containing protein [Terriglobia bacterium]